MLDFICKFVVPFCTDDIICCVVKLRSVWGHVRYWDDGSKDGCRHDVQSD